MLKNIMTTRVGAVILLGNKLTQRINVRKKSVPEHVVYFET